jgi:hypothetical protein
MELGMSRLPKILSISLMLSSCLATNNLQASQEEFDGASAVTSAQTIDDPNDFVLNILSDTECFSFGRFSDEVITKYPPFIDFQDRIENTFRELYLRQLKLDLAKESRLKPEEFIGSRKHDFWGSRESEVPLWDQDKITAAKRALGEWAADPALKMDPTFKELFDKFVTKVEKASGLWYTQDERIKRVIQECEVEFEEKVRESTIRKCFGESYRQSDGTYIHSWDRDRWDWGPVKSAVAKLMLVEFDKLLEQTSNPLLRAVCLAQRLNFIAPELAQPDNQSKASADFSIELKSAYMGVLDQLRIASMQTSDPGLSLKIMLLAGLKGYSYINKKEEGAHGGSEDDYEEQMERQYQHDRKFRSLVRNTWLKFAQDQRLEDASPQILSDLLGTLFDRDDWRSEKSSGMWQTSYDKFSLQTLLGSSGAFHPGVKDDMLHMLKAICHLHASQLSAFSGVIYTYGFETLTHAEDSCDKKFAKSITKKLPRAIAISKGEWMSKLEETLPAVQHLLALSDARRKPANKMNFALRAAEYLQKVVYVFRDVELLLLQKRDQHPTIELYESYLRDLLSYKTIHADLMTRVFNQVIALTKEVVERDLVTLERIDLIILANAHIGLSTLTSDETVKEQQLLSVEQIVAKINKIMPESSPPYVRQPITFKRTNCILQVDGYPKI